MSSASSDLQQASGSLKRTPGSLRKRKSRTLEAIVSAVKRPTDRERQVRQRSLQPSLGVPEGAPYVELSIECRDLRSQKLFPGSKSDPFVVLYTAHPNGGGFTQYDTTETVKNSLHPRFVKSLDLPYRSERSFQYDLSFEVLSRASSSDQLHPHKFLGMANTKISRILEQEFFTLELPLRDLREHAAKVSSATAIVMSSMGNAGEAIEAAKSGYLLVYAEIVQPKLYTHTYSFGFSFSHPVPPEPKKRLSEINKLKRRRGIFIIIERAAKHRPGFFTPVYRSEVLDGKTLDLEGVELLAEKLDGNDDARDIRFVLYENQRSGGHRSFGYFETCMAKLKWSITKGSMIANLKPEPGRFSGYKLEATLVLADVSMEERSSSFSLSVANMKWKAENC